MKITEKEAKEYTKLPIGLIFSFIPKKPKQKKKKPLSKNANISSVHSKARHYRVINGKIVEVDWK